MRHATHSAEQDEGSSPLTRNALHHCFARFAEPGVALADAGRKKKAVAKGVVAQGLHPVRGGWIPWVPGTSPVRVLHRQWLGLSSVPS